MLTRTILALSLAAFALAVPVAQPQGVVDTSEIPPPSEFCFSQQYAYIYKTLASNKVGDLIAGLPIIGSLLGGNPAPAVGLYALPSL